MRWAECCADWLATDEASFLLLERSQTSAWISYVADWSRSKVFAFCSYACPFVLTILLSVRFDGVQ